MAESKEKQTKTERNERRKKQLENEAKLNKVSLNLETEVRKILAAQAREAGMALMPFINKVLETHATDNAPEDDADRQRLIARRAVLDRAVELARRNDAAGGFNEHFILNVMKSAADDGEFTAAYEVATAGTPRAAKRAKSALNQQLGRLIKQAASAKSKRGADGKIQRAQVQDEIITTYTLLEKAA